MFGQDFFKVMQFVVAVLRLMARIFGDQKDKELDDEFGKNHLHEIDKDVHNMAP